MEIKGFLASYLDRGELPAGNFLKICLGVFPCKTNEKSTFLLLVPTWCFKNAFKTCEKSRFLVLDRLGNILVLQKCFKNLRKINIFGLDRLVGVLSASWVVLWASWGVLGFLRISEDS